MKLKHAMFLVFLLLTVCFIAGDKGKTVKAIGYFTSELQLSKVEDIDAYHDYKVNELSINTTLSNPNCQDGYQVYKFTLDKDGYIRMILSNQNVKKITIQSGAKSSYSAADTYIYATVYRDEKLYNAVSATVAAKANANNGKVELSKIALDKGTYYLAIKTDEYYNTLNNNGVTTTSYAIGKGGLIMYYQPVQSQEEYRPSMAGKENKITLDADYKGMLTASNPKDYYTFKLTERALVRFNCMYSSANPMKFILYGGKREELLTKSITGSNTLTKIEKYLEPGTYYCSLETTKQYDGGETYLLINPTYYPLKIEQVNKSTNSYIKVTTIDYPAEVRWLSGKISSADLTNPSWKNAKVITDTLMFGVNQEGYYTVRVTDQYGNMFMDTIKVNKCDTKAPDVPKIKICVAGTFVIKGTAERNSVVTVYVNSRSYTCTANEKGAWTCALSSQLVKGSLIEVTAQDISGNISEKAELILE